MKTIEPPAAKPLEGVIKPVKRILAKIEEIQNEERRLEKVSRDLKREEEGLLKKSDLADPKMFEDISFIRRKREMIPARLKAYSDELDGLTGELTKANSDLEAIYKAALEAAYNGLVARLAQALRPDFTDDAADISEAAQACREHDTGIVSARRAAGSIAPGCSAGRLLVNQLDWLRNGNYRDRKPEGKAEELLQLVEKSKNLTN